MLMRRWIAALAALALASALPSAAAGQDGYDTEPTREQFVAQADPKCQRANERSQERFDRVEKLVRKRKFRKAGRELVGGERIQLKLIGKLREIDRPPADAKRIGKWLRVYERGVETSIRAGKLLKRKKLRRAERKLDEAQEHFKKARKKVRDFGFRHCA